ncbi:MAG: hypothetical protein ACOCP8_02030 [archaeon]
MISKENLFRNIKGKLIGNICDFCNKKLNTEDNNKGFIYASKNNSRKNIWKIRRAYCENYLDKQGGIENGTIRIDEVLVKVKYIKINEEVNKIKPLKIVSKSHKNEGKI